MEVVADQLNEFWHIFEGRLDDTSDTRTRFYGRPEIFVHNVLDFVFLIINHRFELTSPGIERSKLTELILKDLVDIVIKFGSLNSQTK